MDVIYGFHCIFHYRFHCRFHYGFHCKFHAKSPCLHYMYQDFTEINKISWNLQHFTGFHWKQQDFIMDFTVDSIPVKSVMKFIMKSANEIHSEIHNEILLILVKSVEFNDIQKWHEKHLKSEKHNCSWKAQVLFMKSATVHEKCRCFSWKATVHEKRRCFSWKATVHEKCTFHEKRRFSYERPLARNCNPMFNIVFQMSSRKYVK